MSTDSVSNAAEVGDLFVTRLMYAYQILTAGGNALFIHMGTRAPGQAKYQTPW